MCGNALFKFVVQRAQHGNRAIALFLDRAPFFDIDKDAGKA